MSNLIETLVSIAVNWRLCECGYHIGRDGFDGWNQTHQRLEEELLRLQEAIGLLEKWIADTKGKLRLKKKSELAGLEVKRTEIKAKMDAITSEWEQADEETDACKRLFHDALTYCAMRTGIGYYEIFHAALAGFDASQLKAGYQPSKRRLQEIASLLMNLQRGLPTDEWESMEWAKPVSVSMRQKRRVATEMLKAFNAKAIEDLRREKDVTNDGSKPTKKKAGRKPATADEITEEMDAAESRRVNQPRPTRVIP